MKLIASILFFVFSSTIAIPLAQSIFAAKKVTVFVVDEEKSSSNQLNEMKEQEKTIPNYSSLAITTIESLGGLNQGIHSTAVIPPAPLLEKPTPPPNFCWLISQ